MANPIGFNDFINSGDFDSGTAKIVGYLTRITKEISEAKNAAGELSKVLGADLKNQINSLDSTSKKLATDMQDVTNKMTAFKTTTAQVDKVIGDYEKEVERLNKELDKLEKNQTQTTTSTKSAGAAFKSTAQSMLGLASGAALVYSGISTLRKQLNEAITSTLDFEQAMKEVQAISRASGEELNLLTANANKLGATTEKTAGDIARLQKELAKLGFTSAEIILSTQAIVDLSTATGEDLANSATVAASTLRAFGLEAKEMDRVVNTMAGSFVRSGLDLDKFKESMKLVAPLSRATGVSIETTTAALSKLADAGLSGSLAGTSLRNLLSSMADPSEKLTKKLGALDSTLAGGIKTSDDFVKALSVLKKSNIDLAEAVGMVDVRARPAFFTLVNQAEAVESLAVEYEYLDEEARKIAETMRDTLANDLKIAESAFDSLRRNIVEQNIPAMRGFVQDLTSLIEGIRYATQALEDYDTAIQENANNAGVLRKAWDWVTYGFFGEYGLFSLLADDYNTLMDVLGESNNINMVEEQFGSLFTNLDKAIESFGGVSEAVVTLNEAQRILGEGLEGNEEAVAKLRSENEKLSETVDDNRHFLIMLSTAQNKAIKEAEGYVQSLITEEDQLVATIEMLKGFQETVGIGKEQTKQLEEAERLLIIVRNLRLSQTDKLIGLQGELNEVTDEAVKTAEELAEAEEKARKAAEKALKARLKLIKEQDKALADQGKKAIKQAIEEEKFFEKGIKNIKKDDEEKIKLESDLTKGIAKFGEEAREKEEAAAKQHLENLKEYDEEQIKAEKEKWDKIVDITQQAAQGLSEITRFVFDNRALARQNEMDAVDAWESHRIEMAGDNAEAISAIEKEAEEKRRQIKIKQAKDDKKEALFQIAIQTAVNLVKAFPNPLKMILAGAIGVAQAAIVASRPLPAFEKGTLNSPEGKAIVGEKGRELIVDGKTGKARLSKNYASLEYLTKGSKVIPADQTERVLNGVDHNSIAENYLSRSKQANIPQGIDYSKMGDIFKEAVTEIPVNITNFDGNGVSNYVKKRNVKIQRLNKRY